MRTRSEPSADGRPAPRWRKPSSSVQKRWDSSRSRTFKTRWLRPHGAWRSTIRPDDVVMVVPFAGSRCSGLAGRAGSPHSRAEQLLTFGRIPADAWCRYSRSDALDAGEAKRTEAARAAALARDRRRHTPGDGSRSGAARLRTDKQQP